MKLRPAYVTELRRPETRARLRLHMIAVGPVPAGPVTIVNQLSPGTFDVRDAAGAVWCRNLNELRVEVAG